MINQTLVALTNSVLGTSKSTSRGNYAYHCPKCNHHKPKLEINFDTISPHFQKINGIVGFVGLKVKNYTNYLKQ
jgi:hypothetical protein